MTTETASKMTISEADSFLNCHPAVLAADAVFAEAQFEARHGRASRESVKAAGDDYYAVRAAEKAKLNVMTFAEAPYRFRVPVASGSTGGSWFNEV